MEIFSIHVTGDESIHPAARDLKIKTISVDLLRPDRTVLRTEHMTSDVKGFPDYPTCRAYVGELVLKLEGLGVGVVRAKIECPFYSRYDGIYVESHFAAFNDEFPVSRSDEKFLATDRTYDKMEFARFVAAYAEVELCLFDSGEDADWFSLYPKFCRRS